MLPDCPVCGGAAGHTAPLNSSSSVGGGLTMAEGFCGQMQMQYVCWLQFREEEIIVTVNP